MKTLQNIRKIATALTVVAVLVLANSAHAVFTETFDGGAFSASGNVVGNNGWTTGGFRGGSVTPRPSSLTVNTPATAPSLSSGMVAVQNTGGDPGDAFGRDISADIDGDQITVTFDIGGSGVTRFSFGAFGNITNSTGPNHYLYFQFANNSNRKMTSHRFWTNNFQMSRSSKSLNKPGPLMSMPYVVLVLMQKQNLNRAGSGTTR